MLTEKVTDYQGCLSTMFFKDAIEFLKLSELIRMKSKNDGTFILNSGLIYCNF